MADGNISQIVEKCRNHHHRNPPAVEALLGCLRQERGDWAVCIGCDSHPLLVFQSGGEKLKDSEAVR